MYADRIYCLIFALDSFVDYLVNNCDSDSIVFRFLDKTKLESPKLKDSKTEHRRLTGSASGRKGGKIL